MKWQFALALLLCAAVAVMAGPAEHENLEEEGDALALTDALSKKNSFRFVKLDNSSGEFFMTASEVLRGCHEIEKFEIISIEKIVNPGSRRRFEAVRSRFHNSHGAGNAHRLFHGCTLAVSELIAAGGFRPGRSGTLGGGIYFSNTMQKSFLYPMYAGDPIVRVLLLNDVLLGRPLLTGEPHRHAGLANLRARGFDSIIGRQASPDFEPGFWRTECVVFNPSQTLPLYRILIKRK